MRSIVRRTRLFLLVLALALASCSSSESVEEQSKLAGSTAQAAVLVSEAWLSGAAPSHYASAALQSFAETFEVAALQVETSPSSDPAKRQALREAFIRLSIAARRAERAVETEQQAQASQARHEILAARADLAAAYRDYFAPPQ
ncbi:MAG: hypothetical protein E5X48_06660 [Mesorhizobium sp.]|uniref:hypothetical protein n=1 Tax=Mesorhizobium sp. TaxID=1871066 RepID=UPI0012034883|nr:hypothetical protein [Mesorhizobium sp.]TIQ37055.1 MAG: hypothetical protein E5X48_06660 [Mesorhizobium sp.]